MRVRSLGQEDPLEEEMTTHSSIGPSVQFSSVQLLSCVWLFVTNHLDYSLPGSSVHGIFPAKILEWVAISSSRGSSLSRDLTCISYVSLLERWILYHWPPRNPRAVLGLR